MNKLIVTALQNAENIYPERFQIPQCENLIFNDISPRILQMNGGIVCAEQHANIHIHFNEET